MTLDELKTELENRTEFRFEKKSDFWHDETLELVGLEKKTELKLYFFINDNKKFISVSGYDNRDGRSGCGIPCDNIDKTIKWLNEMAYEYGWKPSNEQISF